MRTPHFSERTVLNIQAAAVLLAFVFLLIAVPHEWLKPLSAGFTIFAVAVVVVIRIYLRRLQEAVSFLTSRNTASTDDLLAALLTAAERSVLRLPPGLTAVEGVRILRQRQSAFTSLAMCVALPGICAFLIVVVFYFPD
jgi:hypothetical protein